MKEMSNSFFERLLALRECEKERWVKIDIYRQIGRSLNGEYEVGDNWSYDILWIVDCGKSSI